MYDVNVCGKCKSELVPAYSYPCSICSQLSSKSNKSFFEEIEQSSNSCDYGICDECSKVNICSSIK